MRDHNPSQRPEVAAKISASKMGHEVTEETIEKIKKAWTPELKEQAKDNLNARRDDVNKAIEEFWADPQNREEQSKIKKQIQNKPEVKKKVGDASRKRWQDPEYHEKQCETHKQFWADPEEREKQRQRQLEHWEEHPEKREEYSERFSGKDNPNYKDGKCHEGRGPGWDKIRKAIRERDGHCQMCGVLESTDGDGLDAHHVDGDKHNHAYRNLIALCNKCHSSLNNRELFDIWQRIFESMIDLKYGLQISNA
ncbi:hypothetical protein KAU11_05320, partial [Candidatus Babeliales bacterium]|nr:hypothetical protein [Candidatus Babeliales bacterium]